MTGAVNRAPATAGRASKVEQIPIMPQIWGGVCLRPANSRKPAWRGRQMPFTKAET